MAGELNLSLAHELVGDALEHLRVQRLAQRLRLGLRPAQGPGALLELDADAFDVGRALVPVPGDALDADLGDDAPEAPVAVHQRGVHAFAGRPDGRRETAGPAADDQHVGLGQHRDRPGALFDLSHAPSVGIDKA